MDKVRELLVNLNEDSQLYSGIFWVKDEIPDKDLYFQVPVDMYGDPQGDKERLNAKSGNTFNHEKTWKELSSKITGNKGYNYYPRGRVVISNRKAIIWANPNICTEGLREWCIREFNLNKRNGITKVDMKPDYSEHYKCYLDES